MRADRLVSTLLMLQARGTVTAREVAAELEVSERTARRDLEALSAAGIPVYSTRGYRGGWQLIGGARTDLTGLRAPEAEALLMMAAVAGQGSPDFASAMQKLTQALPEPIRVDAERAMASIVSDSSSWNNRGESIPRDRSHSEWLNILRDAVSEHRSVTIKYEARKGTTTRSVDPLGLITKRQTWYLFADTPKGHRTFRLDRIQSVASLPHRFEPPESFDLDAAWAAVTERFENNPARVTARALVPASMVAQLRASGIEAAVMTEATGDEPAEVELSAWSATMLAEKIAGMIDRIELLDPPAELGQRLAAIGNQLISRFG